LDPRVSLQLGYGAPLNGGGGESLNEFVSSIALAGVTVDFRAEGRAFLGLYGHVARGFINADGALRGCDADGFECSSWDYAFGGHGLYQWRVGPRWDLNGSFGAAYEIWTISVTSGEGPTSATVTGALFPLEVAAEYAISPHLHIGPMAFLLVSRYVFSSGSIRSPRNVWHLQGDENALQLWGLLGVSISYAF
jgi:hypothetical protein